MKTQRKSLIAATLTASLMLAACSSSNDTPVSQGNGGNVPGFGGTPINNDDTPAGNATGSVDLRTINESSIRSLAGYGLQTVSEEIGLIADSIVATAPSSTTLPSFNVELIDQGAAQEFPVTSIQYNCSQGGTLTRNTLLAEVFQNGYSSNTKRVTDKFDQCKPTADIDQTLNGEMSVSERSETGDRFTTNEEKIFSWQAFQWQKPGDITDNITAIITINTVTTQGNDDLRNVSITEYTRSEAGVVKSGVKNATFTLRDLSTTGGAIFEFTLETQGEIIHPSGASISVLTDPAMYRKFVNPSIQEPSTPFGGQIKFTSSDGSSLQMIGKGSEAGRRLVDIVYTDTTGTTTTAENQTFIELEVNNL